jgi:HAD superfamily phosphatase (TIGR01668 family)
MWKYFLPDFYFDKYSDITPQFLLENNIRTLLLDVDNTLAPYEQSEPDEKILAWLSALRENGISFAFISNNSSPDRINLFNKSIGAPAYAKSAKPLAKNTNRALAELGAKKEETAFLGDQIFTDVLAAHGVGIPAILVPPINDKKDLLTRSKRVLEKPILRKYERRKNK